MDHLLFMVKLETVEAEAVDKIKVEHQVDQAVAEVKEADHQEAEVNLVLEILEAQAVVVGRGLAVSVVKMVLVEAHQKQVEQHYHHQLEELQKLFLEVAAEQVQVQLGLKQLLFLEWVELVEQHQAKEERL